MVKLLVFIFSTTVVINHVACIDNGTIAYLGQFGYAVSIWYRGNHACGGALLTRRHILTAGHCVYGLTAFNFRVITGFAKLTLVNASTWYQVENVYVHPAFEMYRPYPTESVQFAKNDIALMTLVEPVPIDPTIRTIPMAAETHTTYYRECKTFLFRQVPTDNIHTMQMQLRWTPTVPIRFEDCLMWYPYLPLYQTCIQNPLRPYRAIAGDSGSPIVCDGKIFGLYHGSVDLTISPKIINLVAPYLEFILDTINGCD